MPGVVPLNILPAKIAATIIVQQVLLNITQEEQEIVEEKKFVMDAIQKIVITLVMNVLAKTILIPNARLFLKNADIASLLILMELIGMILYAALKQLKNVQQKIKCVILELSTMKHHLLPDIMMEIFSPNALMRNILNEAIKTRPPFGGLKLRYQNQFYLHRRSSIIF